MIDLIGSPGDLVGKIRFTPRDKFKRKYPILEKELIYGFRCTRCGNVILAYWRTDEPVNLWPYEETNILSLSEDHYGEVINIYPNENSKHGYSCYENVTIKAGSEVGQRIRLKKHLLLNEPVLNMTTSDIFETGGEHCCEYTGWWSLRSDLMLKDILLANMADTPEELAFATKHTVSEFVGTLFCNKFRALQGIGNVPPAVLVNRQSFRDGRYASDVTGILNEFTPVVEEGETV